MDRRKLSQLERLLRSNWSANALLARIYLPSVRFAYRHPGAVALGRIDSTTETTYVKVECLMFRAERFEIRFGDVGLWCVFWGLGIGVWGLGFGTKSNKRIQHHGF